MPINLPVRVAPEPTRGLLFIGDPHLWSSRPGRRRDPSFQETVLKKIDAAAEVSNARQLWPIFLGDLFHAPDDNDTAMLVALVQRLQSFKRRPLTAEGNHDKSELLLAAHNPLALLQATGQIEVLTQSGPWAQLALESEQGHRHKIWIGGTPYGQPLPTTFENAFGQARPVEVDTALWLTHEDLAFEGAYPGSLPLHAISGVDMVVNGHMHGHKRPVAVEGTAYYNPGNITRMSVDMAEHVPAVWEWSPFGNDGMASASGQRVPALLRHVLPHKPAAETFDFEGRHTRQVALMPAVVPENSQFVRIMAMDPNEQRTDDGAYAQETLTQVLDELHAPEQVRTITDHLCRKAIRQHQERSE